MDVLIVAAHPDDEALGVGGTRARYAPEGARVHVLFLADGVTSRPDTGEGDKTARLQAARDACRILGAEPPRSLALPDNRLDTVPLLTIVQ